jgi:hypothetical protein
MTFTRTNLRASISLLILSPALPLAAVGQVHGEPAQQLGSVTKVPSGVLIVKGAWASASDTTTPVPEGGKIADSVYTNPYFRLTYPLFHDWMQKYEGPPPSDSGSYVLAQVEPGETIAGAVRGSLLITAADLFFSPTGADNALQFVNFTRTNLQADYKVTRAPTQITLAGQTFVRFDYVSPVAGLHWYVLATQIRCHVVQFVFTSRDVKLLDQQIDAMSKVKLVDESAGAEVPVCIKNYASPENIVERVDPILLEHKFNPIPVRVIIDKEGRVKHSHIISAFPSQSKTIADALQQWKFKPYLRAGQPVEVETGILFGRPTGGASTPLGVTTSAANVTN